MLSASFLARRESQSQRHVVTHTKVRRASLGQCPDTQTRTHTQMFCVVCIASMYLNVLFMITVRYVMLLSVWFAWSAHVHICEQLVFRASPPSVRSAAIASGVHKGGFSKGGFSNTNIIITHKLLNPPLLSPPLWTPESPVAAAGMQQGLTMPDLSRV